MNVLYLHQHFSTPQGATGIRSYAMARKLIMRGHGVTIVCGSYGGGKTGLIGNFTNGRREGLVDGIHIIEFDLSYSNNDSFLKRTLVFIRFALRSIALVFTLEYDVLFATTTPLTAGIPGIFARWFRGKPFVFEVRDLWPELPREMGVIKNPLVLGLMSGLEWLSYCSAHLLIGLSPGIVDGISRFGAEKENVAIIPNGCDLTIFSNNSRSWRPTGVLKSDLMAIYTGTHGIANGLDALLDVAAVLKKRGRTDIKLVLVGQGKLKSVLQQRAKDEQLDNVIFHPPVNKEKLAGLMSSADLGIQSLANVPSFYYGTSPNKFFDYIAACLPVLCNYPGWLVDMIEEYDCGFAVPPNDATAFADALELAESDRSMLQQMGGKGRKLAEDRFNREDLSSQFVDWLEMAGKK